MKIRAVICDVYKTILDVGPPPDDAEARWDVLCLKSFHGRIPLRLPEFHGRYEEIIAREHAQARVAGIAYPEIYWPNVAAEALPDLSVLCAARRDEFLFRHAALQHRVSLMPGAAEVLQKLARQGVILGIASNAQPYTLRELDEALATANLSRHLFQPELCFWSFEHGFGKPDPHVFRLLSARLTALGITARETLIIGDRQDNDIEPAKAQGWRTWRLSNDVDAEAQGNWESAGRHLFSQNAQTRPVH